ncbi:MAG TPA: hypothetical protein VFX60_03315 [Micromonospora sp.]|nr:hypothetical protein [Micromonospora sp.]
MIRAHPAALAGPPIDWRGLVRVLLFAGTERVAEYRPRFGPAAVLAVPTGCSPCRQFVCPYGQECLDVTPERVAAATLRLAAARDRARA